MLVVGGGCREAALAGSLTHHGHHVVCTTQGDGLLRHATFRGEDPVEAARGCDLAVVGPEAPLVAGLADTLAAHGVPCFGPSRAAARIEGSKVFARAFCARHGIPMAAGGVVGSVDEARARADGRAAVVKLDGLAAGKGTWVCEGPRELDLAVERALATGQSVLVEERLAGPELSVMALCDGARMVPLPPARDHKRRGDGDAGPNTGGMGAFAPVAVASETLAACHAMLARAVSGLACEGAPFRGVLYGGFMLTESGPRLLEFNARFGDPECQTLLALLDEDPAPWLLGAAQGRLPEGAPRFRDGVACTVVAVSEGYPDTPCDVPLLGLPTETQTLHVHAGGVVRTPDGLRARGGRVVSVTAVAPGLAAARLAAYHALRAVRFPGVSWRTDIGAVA